MAAFPGGMPAAVPDRDVLTPEQLARAEDYAGTTRLIGWAALAVSLAVSWVFGFTSLGTRVLGRGSCPGRSRSSASSRSSSSSAGWPRCRSGGPCNADVRLRPEYAERCRLVAGPGPGPRRGGDRHLDRPAGAGRCARRWRTWWPVIAAGVSAALVLLGSFVYPLLVEPLFNDFTSMPEGELRTQILRLADEEGVTVDDVLVADASRRTTTLNAYVSASGAPPRRGLRQPGQRPARGPGALVVATSPPTRTTTTCWWGPC